MKRLYYAFVSLAIVLYFPLFFSMNVKASSPHDYIANIIINEWGLTGFNASTIDEILEYYFENPNYQLLVINFNYGNKIRLVCASSVTYDSDVVVINYVAPGKTCLIDPYNSNYGTTSTINGSTINTDHVVRHITFNSYDEATNSSIDYDNPVYSSQIPVPNMVVTCTNIPLTFGNSSQVYTRCDVSENEAFYIQLQAKFSVADTVKIGLSNGVYTYEYLTWDNGSAYDMFELGSNESEIHVTPQQFNSLWSDIIDGFIPQFTSSVPFWAQNPTAQKYIDAQNNYVNKLMLQFPLFGSRLELFARYYAVVDDVCYVGKWIHWNSANPSNTEELSNQYQQDQPYPGYQNESTNENLPEEQNTYTNFGENTGVNNDPYTNVIINNNVPNYPDYPTAVSYNHDNILLQFINTANQLPTFFGEMGSFLTSTFAFIPSEIWVLVGFGFMCSIVVMIIKVL